MSTPQDGDRLLRDLFTAFQQLDRRMAEDSGIHLTDLMLLRILVDAAEPLAAGALSRAVGLTSGAATAAIDRLVRAGFARREPSPTDRRGVMVAPIRSAARKVLAKVQAVKQRRELIWREFSAAERDAIVRFLARNGEVVRQWANDTGTRARAKRPRRASDRARAQTLPT